MSAPCLCPLCQAQRALAQASCCPNGLAHGVHCICGVTIRVNASVPFPGDADRLPSPHRFNETRTVSPL